MYTPNFWYQLYLHRRKIIISTFLIADFWLCPMQSQAQKTIQLPNYDLKNLHYGLQLGLYRSYGYITPSASFAQQDTMNIIDVSNPGFSIGFILNVALWDVYWNFRILPNFAYYAREISFQDILTGEQILKSSETYFLEIPVLLKYKSKRRVNKRMYIIAGLVPSFRVGTKVEGNEDDSIPYASFNFEITYGFGLSSFQKYVSFAPEIRFSHGIQDILGTGISNEFTQQISKITTLKVGLYLNFEG